MQNRSSLFTVVAVLATALGMSDAADQSDAVKIVSPDARVQFEVFVQEARLRYSVTFRSKAVVETSPMVFAVDGVDLTEGVEAGEVRRYSLNETYPWRGVHAQAVNHCNGATISLKHAKSNTGYTLEVRAFNDGVAFRYVIPGDEKPRVPDESTAIIRPCTSARVAPTRPGHTRLPPLLFSLRPCSLTAHSPRTF